VETLVWGKRARRECVAIEGEGGLLLLFIPPLSSISHTHFPFFLVLDDKDWSWGPFPTKISRKVGGKLFNPPSGEETFYLLFFLSLSLFIPLKGWRERERVFKERKSLEDDKGFSLHLCNPIGGKREKKEINISFFSFLFYLFFLAKMRLKKKLEWGQSGWFIFLWEGWNPMTGER
jgi:hypothetical protein